MSNFATAAASIRADQAEAAERERDTLRRWSDGVECAVEYLPPLVSNAYAAIQELKDMRGAGNAEYAAIFAELFRQVSRDTVITRGQHYRDAAACLSDLVIEFAGAAQLKEEPPSWWANGDPDADWDETR